MLLDTNFFVSREEITALSAQLKELEASSIIHREQYNEVPPHVEYSLTEEVRTLIPILELMYQWGQEHMK